jgi:hypothetical protein
MQIYFSVLLLPNGSLNYIISDTKIYKCGQVIESCMRDVYLTHTHTKANQTVLAGRQCMVVVTHKKK